MKSIGNPKRLSHARRLTFGLLLVILAGCTTNSPSIQGIATPAFPKAEDILETWDTNSVETLTSTFICNIASNASLSAYTVAVSDSGMVAYAVEVQDKKWAITMGDKVYQAYESVSCPVFTSDGVRFGYSAMENGQWKTIVDETVGQLFDQASPLTFSSDGRRWAYTAKEGETWYLITEKSSKRLPLEGSAQLSHVVFSPDGSHEAYVVKRGNTGHVVVDGESGPQYEEVTPPVFSRDGKHLAYFAATRDDVLLVVDHETSLSHGKANLADLHFSIDGRKLVYTIYTSDPVGGPQNSVVVVAIENGMVAKIKEFGPISIHVSSLQPFTSANITGSPWCPSFSPDGSKIIFGVNGGPPSQIETPFRMDSPGQYYYIQDTIGSSAIYLNGTRIATIKALGVLTPFSFTADGKEVRWFQLSKDGLFLKRLCLK